MNLLITGGATREQIDKVRFISNMSTGKTAKVLVNYLKKFHKITFIKGSYLEDVKGVTNLNFTDFVSLKKILKVLSKKKKFDVIIHNAAISDYTIRNLVLNGKQVKKSKGKISSSGLNAIYLKPTSKLIDLPIFKNPLVIAFKLTSTFNKKEQQLAINKLYKHHHVNLVIHNDLNQILHDAHRFMIYPLNVLALTKIELAKKIQKIIKEYL